jgi:hypothetical protein
MAYMVWQILTYFSLTTLLMKMNFEFFAKRRLPATFCLAKKIGEIDPRFKTLSLRNQRLKKKILEKVVQKMGHVIFECPLGRIRF